VLTLGVYVYSTQPLFRVRPLEAYLSAQHGLQVIGTGLVAGPCASLVLTRFLSTLLYEINAIDVTTFAAVAMVLVIVALAANYFPRAARPMSIQSWAAIRVVMNRYSLITDRESLIHESTNQQIPESLITPRRFTDSRFRDSTISDSPISDQ